MWSGAIPAGVIRVLCCRWRGEAPTGTDDRGAQLMLARLWTVLDALPAGEVLARVRELLGREAGATADGLAARLQDLAAAFSRLRRRDDLALLVAGVIP